MSISGVNGMGATVYTYTNRSKETADINSFEMRYKKQRKAKVPQ